MREEQVMLVEGGNVGNGVMIPKDFDRSGQTGQVQFSVMSRQGATIEKVDG
jgi:hypothetical protein